MRENIRRRHIYTKTSAGTSLHLSRRAEPENHKVLILVHGLAGDAVKTWGTLPELIASDPELSFFDVAIFGYKARMSPLHIRSLLAGRLPISEIGRELSQYLLTDLIAGDRYTHVAILAHSLGAFVSMAAVRELVEVYGAVGASKIHSLLFYGVPYAPRGSWLVRLIDRILLGRNAQVRELSSLSNFWIRSVSGTNQGELRFWIPQAWLYSSRGAAVDVPYGAKPETYLVDKGERDLLTIESRNDPLFMLTRSLLLRNESLQEERLEWTFQQDRLGRLPRENWQQYADHYDRLAELIADDDTLVVQLVGASGSGKTSLLEAAISQLDPSRFRVVRLPRREPGELDALKRHVGASGGGAPSTVLVIDEVELITDFGRELDALKELVRWRSFDKFILAGRKTVPLEEAAGPLRQATIHLPS